MQRQLNWENKNSTYFIPITGMCICVFLIGLIVPNIAAILGISLSFWLTMRAKPDGLLGLFLLYFSKNHFFPGYGLVGPTLSLGSFPLKVETLMCGFIAFRVVIEIISSPSTFRSKLPMSMLYGWLIIFIPVLIAFYLSFQTRNENWTRGLRWLMISGSYFYGYILLKNLPRNINYFGLKLLLATIIPMSFVMLLLMSSNIFWSHHGFFFLGVGGAFSVYYIRNKSAIYFCFGIGLLLTTCFFAKDSSLTGMAITLLAFFLSIICSKRKLKLSPFYRFISYYSGQIIIFSIIIFTGVVLFIGLNSLNEISIARVSDGVDFQSRIKNKLFSDRLPFWMAAYLQIIEGPFFIVKSGRILNIPGINHDWVVGSHNTILELLRINGIVAGGFIIFIYFFALKNNLFVFVNSKEPMLRTFSAAVLSVGIVGMVTGDFPADLTLGFWLWSISGFSHGLFLNEKKDQSV